MIIRRAYKFQLKATGQQNNRLRRFAGCVRRVWNMAWNIQKARLEQAERVLTYGQMASELVNWKKELPFLKEVHSQPLQQVLMDLDRALKDHFKKTKGPPKFKKRDKDNSFRFPQGTKIDNDKVYLPKIGWVRFRKSREIEGTIKNVTLSRTLDNWYVSIQVEMEVPEPMHPSKSVVGIDMGVVQFATMSDGTVIQPINIFRKLEPKLAREQRKLGPKVKGSKNWKKQKRKVQKVHNKIANVRRDFQQKATTAIAKNHGVVVMEDLQIKNMTKSAKGTIEEPGTNVAAKAGLNKSICDQGWYEFRRQIIYKQLWLGGRVILVSAINTSRKCSKCDHVAPGNRQSQALFLCQECGYEANADVNAAINILAAGRAVLACGNQRNAA